MDKKILDYLMPEDNVDDLEEFLITGIISKCTKRQRGYIIGLCNKLNITRESLKYNINNLTFEEASQLINELLRDVEFLNDMKKMEYYNE